MSRRRSPNVLHLTPEQAAELGLDLARDLAQGKVAKPAKLSGKWDGVNAARARRVEGAMSGPERRRAAELQADLESGLILDWHHQPFSFRLGRGCRYTPDFVVVDADGLLRAEEVKGAGGWLNEKSKPKWKVAGELYRWMRFAALLERKAEDHKPGRLGRWDVEIYLPHGDWPAPRLEAE